MNIKFSFTKMNTNKGIGKVHIILTKYTCFIIFFLIPFLVHAGVNLDLIIAAKKGELKKVENLLQNGADVNSKEEKRNQVALVFASSRGYIEIVKTLLDNGADATIKDKNNWTALDWARKKKHNKIVRILVKHLGRKTITKKPEVKKKRNLNLKALPKRLVRKKSTVATQETSQKKNRKS